MSYELTNTVSNHNPEAQPSPLPLPVHCFTYEERDTLLPDLLQALHNSGAWFAQPARLAQDSVELSLELDPRTIMDAYACLISAGIELTCAAHLTMTECCSCSFQWPASVAGHPVHLRIVITFLSWEPLIRQLAHLTSASA